MNLTRLMPCAICGSSDFSLVFKAEDLNYKSTESEFSLMRCRACGLVCINPRPEDMTPFYPDSYAQHKPNPNVRYKPSIQKKLALFYGYPGPAWQRQKAWNDIRIMSIFEGSNGIQAQDLVGRKLPQQEEKRSVAC